MQLIPHLVAILTLYANLVVLMT